MDETTRILQDARQAAKDAVRMKKQAEDLISNIGPTILDALEPALAKLASDAKTFQAQMVDALQHVVIKSAGVNVSIPEIKVPEAKVTVTVPKIEVPKIVVPEPKVTVNMPPIDMSQFKLPAYPDPLPFPTTMDMRMSGNDRAHPLAVEVTNQPAQPKVIRAVLTDATGVDISSLNGLPVTFSATGTTATALVDSSGVQYSGSNPLPTTSVATLSAATGQGDTASALRIVHAGDSATSVATQSQGLNETTSGALRVVLMSDTANSSQSKLIAMTTNPSTAADASPVFEKADKIGRSLTTPIQVRQLRTTAYATLNSNNETTLIAGIATTFLDLIYVTLANASSAAVSVDIRQGTGGSVIGTVNVPANATQGFSLMAPIPMTELAQSWTLKFNTDIGSDLSNTKVYATGLFSQEI